ncbi:MAG: 30S ribosomal protein S20 [Candidatus Omnitrophota bacterium]
MPIKQAAKKALRQSLRRQKRNLTYYYKIKGLIKRVRVLTSQKKINEAKSLLPQIYQALDKAAKVGVIKKNAASRQKSRITKLVSKSQ